ncbi:MAG TPA: response regulator [Actinomycetota bacterium]
MKPSRPVLIVDDNADVRMLYERVLMSAGYTVAHASDAREALDSIAAGLPSIVLLDVLLPGGLDGWETLETIRATEASAALPVIMCTVKRSSEDQQRGWTLGCDGFMIKAFNPWELQTLIDEVLARTPEERAAERARNLKRATEGLEGV